MSYMRIAVLCLLLPLVAVAQPSVELHQALLDLANDGVVMNISAHPDDEDGATLAYYRMKHGAKTYSLFFTRGEGGQNETGSELYEELGALRTEETIQAASIIGSKVYFLNLRDFGYSKTATETFRVWGGKNEVLRRLVYFIRLLKPDVMFTNHNTIAGHGHHQAVAITAIEAFDAAADSTMFPDQLSLPGLDVWQPRKLYFRNFGRLEQTADVVNRITEVNDVRGHSYLEIASNALRMHRTQGMDRADLRSFTRGLSLYRLMRANSLYDADTTTFLGGIDLWRDPATRILKPLRMLLSRLHAGMSSDSVLSVSSSAMLSMDMLQPAALSPLGRRLVANWQDALQRLVIQSAGIQARLTLEDPVVVARQRVNSVLEVTADRATLSRVRQAFRLPRRWVMNERPDTAPEITSRMYRRQYVLIVGEDPVWTLPETIAQYRPIEDRQQVFADVSLHVSGHPVVLSIEAEFDVAPAQVLTIQPTVGWVHPFHHKRGYSVQYTITNHLPHKVAGRLAVQAPPGWSSESVTFTIAHEDSSATGSVFIRPPKDVPPGDYTVRFRTEYAMEEITLKVFDTEVDRTVNVGIVRSYDNTLEEALNELEVHYTLLGERDLARGDLGRFSTILVDIRAYLVRDDLKQHNARLLEYVRNGGSLVVMYQRDQEWKPEYAPYPFRISRRRITDETSPVHMLVPDHPLLTTPNRIAEADWSGWKQERGVYFPTEVGNEYTRLLSSSDPDEAPLTTGYLVTSHGRGSYIYTSYVWYRQLREKNPGAFRCLANMISYRAGKMTQ